MPEENDDKSIGIENDGDTENEDVVFQDKSSSDEVKNGGISNASRFVSQREIISIIFSKKTLYHVIVLFSLLLFFGIISYTKSDLASSLILIFGYGSSLGYFLTAALNRFEVVKNLSRSKSFTSLILPLSLSLVFSSFFWAAINNQIYGANMERFLTWGYIFIFVIWQFAQAWWMRVPFKEIALRKMASSEDNSPTNFPFGLPIWDKIIILAFSLIKNFNVGRILSILVVSVILSLSNGTFKSSLNNIFLFFRFFSFTILLIKRFYAKFQRYHTSY